MTSPGTISNNKLEDFVHESLDLTPERQCVRLPKIILSSREDEVQCEMMSNVRLADNPRYMALSYEW